MRDDGLIILSDDESFWGLESTLRVKTRRFFFWKFRDFEVVELSWVTYPEKIKKVFWDGLIVMGDLPGWKRKDFLEIFSKWWKIQGFLKWSCCNGWPAQVKNMKIFQRGEKYRDFSKWSCCNGQPAQVFQSDEKYEDFSKWFHCNGQPAQMKDEKNFQKGLIVMGDLPMWKKNSWRDDMIGLKGTLFKRQELIWAFEKR